MLDKVKAPMYAPYIMKLIKFKETGSPLVDMNLVTHKPVRPQKKGLKSGKASGASGSRVPLTLVMRSVRSRGHMCLMLAVALA